MATDSGGRTFIGTVVCIDLVGYSTRSVEQQIAIKALFNRLLAKALKPVPAADRMILDTGDGAAVTLMGDPEPALDLTAEIRRLMGAEAAALGAPNGAVRIAVNLGSVRVGTDMNGYPKLVGDALNVAQSLLAFAAPGQAVVSRSFHEVVASLSAANAARFRPLGWRKDLDGREHEIHALAEPAAKEAPARREPKPAAVASPRGNGGSREGALVAFLRDKRKVGVAAVVLLAVIAVEAVLLARRGTPAPTVASAPPPEAPKIVEKAAPRVETPPVSPPAATKPAPVTSPSAPAVSKAPLPVPAQAVVPPPAKTAAPLPAPATIPAPATKPAPPPAAATPVVSPAPPATAPAKAPAAEKPAARKGAQDPKKGAAKVAPPPKREEPEPVPEAPAPAPAPVPTPPPAPAPSGPPTPLFRAPVAFPIEAARKNIDEGVVRARVTVDAAGAVTQVRVLDAKPPRVFNTEALRSLRQWKFDAGADNRTLDVEIAFKR